MKREEAEKYIKSKMCNNCSVYLGGGKCSDNCKVIEAIKALEQTKIGYCKDCKEWKDSDGVFRRGVGAESNCRINSDIVYEGNGYCYMFKPKDAGRK